jgi:hypothetical protein
MVKMKQETLEEVLGSSMCEFSVIENKLAILYRNQVKIYEAIINQQAERMYSEEEVKRILMKTGNYTKISLDTWFKQFKKK